MESGRTLSPEPLGFFALGFHRQGGRTARQKPGYLACPLQSALQLELRPQRALPSGAVIFGLQGITGATGTRTVAGPRAVVPCKSGQPKPHLVLGEYT